MLSPNHIKVTDLNVVDPLFFQKILCRSNVVHSFFMTKISTLCNERALVDELFTIEWDYNYVLNSMCRLVIWYTSLVNSTGAIVGKTLLSMTYWQCCNWILLGATNAVAVITRNFREGKLSCSTPHCISKWSSKFWLIHVANHRGHLVTKLSQRCCVPAMGSGAKPWPLKHSGLFLKANKSMQSGVIGVYSRAHTYKRFSRWF